MSKEISMKSENMERRRNPHGLSEKEMLFCENYMSAECLGNATKAFLMTYGDTGRAQTTMMRAIRRLFGDDRIKAYLDDIRAERRARAKISEEQLVDSALNVFQIALKGNPRYVFNPATKKMEVDTANPEYDVRALNECIRTIGMLSGYDVTGKGKDKSTSPLIYVNGNDQLLSALLNNHVEGTEEEDENIEDDKSQATTEAD